MANSSGTFGYKREAVRVKVMVRILQNLYLHSALFLTWSMFNIIPGRLT